MSVLAKNRPVYFFGCDMGGWHTRDKDALAFCEYHDGNFSDHESEDSGRHFYPLPNDGPLLSKIRSGLAKNANCIVAIDAALGWPRDFLRLAMSTRRASHLPVFNPNDGQIQNRYLFRETERFIKQFVKRDKDPFTAPGDSFGNNSSKAQALVASIKAQFPNAYRPPFDAWDKEKSIAADLTIIEVYPAASMASDKFRHLKWHVDEGIYADMDASDENDAKRCATSAICYAMTIGLIPHLADYPKVWLPDEATDHEDYDSQRIPKEGWIFAPKRKAVPEGAK